MVWEDGGGNPASYPIRLDSKSRTSYIPAADGSALFVGNPNIARWLVAGGRFFVGPRPARWLS